MRYILYNMLFITKGIDCISKIGGDGNKGWQILESWVLMPLPNSILPLKFCYTEWEEIVNWNDQVKSENLALFGAL